ncbi:MAG TPA: MerR family transcriptional regulator [Acidimicrobiia bacterium]
MSASSPDPDLLAIGRFASLCRISVKTLRHYHEIGLLEPACVDRATGYRYYRMEQSRTAAAIVTLRGLDVPLHEIREVVTSSDPSLTAEVLSRQRRRLASRLADSERRLAVVEQLLAQEGDMTYDITEIDVPAVRVVSERVSGPQGMEAIAQAAGLTRLVAALERARVEPVAQPIVVVHDGDEEHFDDEVCLPIGDEAVVPDDVVARELEPMHAATTTHVGPLDEVQLAVHAVIGWVQGRGHRFELPVRVRFVSMPPFFTVAEAGGGDQPVTEVLVRLP